MILNRLRKEDEARASLQGAQVNRAKNRARKKVRTSKGEKEINN